MFVWITYVMILMSVDFSIFPCFLPSFNFYWEDTYMYVHMYMYIKHS